MGNDRDLQPLGASLKELADQGFLVDLSVAITEDHRGEVLIEQVGDSTIVVLPDGLTAYFLYVILINSTAKTIYLRGLELRVPWEDSGLELVPEFGDTAKAHQNCFPRLCDLRPSRNQHNRRGLLEHGMLTNRPLQGRLYAVGGPLPKKLQHGATCQAIVATSDMNRCEYHGTVDFWIDRLTLASNTAAPELHSHVGKTAGSPNSPGAADATLENH